MEYADYEETDFDQISVEEAEDILDGLLAAEFIEIVGFENDQALYGITQKGLEAMKVHRQRIARLN